MVEEEAAEDRALLERIRGSELWRTMQLAITEERETLFQTSPLSNELLWRREGALQMLTYLLHQLPTLVVLTSRRERRKRDADGG
jgi:hypothetical protein